jgi:hypothetical protein
MPTDGQAADLRGPRGGTARPNGTRDITVMAVTTSSVQKDPGDSNHFNGAHWQGKFVRLISDQTVYYFWTDAVAQTVSETAADGTNPTQQCDVLPAFERREEVAAGANIVIKGAAAGVLRIAIVQTVED